MGGDTATYPTSTADFCEGKIQIISLNNRVHHECFWEKRMLIRHRGWIVRWSGIFCTTSLRIWEYEKSGGNRNGWLDVAGDAMAHSYNSKLLSSATELSTALINPAVSAFRMISSTAVVIDTGCPSIMVSSTGGCAFW